jgi:signal transduction histidine kinase/DNA-binding NtrC family response regulator
LVEDNPGDARLFEAYLEGFTAEVVQVGRLGAAVERLGAEEFSAVLLDLGLPDSQGLDTLDAAIAAAGDVPVIVLTGSDDDATGDDAVRRGAEDFLSKATLDGRTLRRAIRYAHERQRARRAQITSEERYRTLFETVTQGMLTQDLEGRVTNANPAAAALLGVELSALTGRTLDELGLSFVDAAGRPTTIAAAPGWSAPARGPEATEAVVGLAGGGAGAPTTARWLALHCTPRGRGAGAHPAYTLVSDVTAEHAMVEALSLNDRRLQLQLDLLNAPRGDTQELLDEGLAAAIALTASQLGYIFKYREAEQQLELHAWSRGAMDLCRVLAPQTTYDLAETGLWGEVVRQRRPIMVNAFAMPNPLKRGHPEGHVALERFLSVPVFDAGRIVAVIGVANKAAPYTQTDVLQLSLLMDGLWRVLSRLEVEAAQRATAEQLRQSQKTEAVGRLAGGMAHDFNNLLSVILNRADFSLAALEDPHSSPPRGDLIEDLREIRLAGDRAATLVRQMLAFSRRQVLELTTVDLNGVVSDFEQMLRRLLPEDTTLTVSRFPELWETVVDRGRFEQVLVNLVVNARDAIDGTGRIEIATCNSVLDETMAGRLAGARPGEFVRLTVSDTGSGMSQDTLAHIFEPFFTTKPAGFGTGLGLSMVEGLVQQCHGFVAVRSEVDTGTHFEIYLPRGRTAGRTVRQPRPDRGGRWPGVSALVVEDDAAVRSVLARILEGAGLVVTAVARSAEALAAAEAATRPIGLLVTSVVLPFMNGPELATRVTRLHPEIAVIFLASCADTRLIEARADGAGPGVLLKPFDAGSLLSHVRAALADGGRPPTHEEGQPDAGGTREALVEAGLHRRLTDALQKARLDDASRAVAELARVAPASAAALRSLLEQYDYDGALRWLRDAAPQHEVAP